MPQLVRTCWGLIRTFSFIHENHHSGSLTDSILIARLIQGWNSMNPTSTWPEKKVSASIKYLWLPWKCNLIEGSNSRRCRGVWEQVWHAPMLAVLSEKHTHSFFISLIFISLFSYFCAHKIPSLFFFSNFCGNTGALESCWSGTSERKRRGFDWEAVVVAYFFSTPFLSFLHLILCHWCLEVVGFDRPWNGFTVLSAIGSCGADGAGALLGCGSGAVLEGRLLSSTVRLVTRWSPGRVTNISCPPSSPWFSYFFFLFLYLNLPPACNSPPSTILPVLHDTRGEILPFSSLQHLFEDALKTSVLRRGFMMAWLFMRRKQVLVCFTGLSVSCIKALLKSWQCPLHEIEE